jgi:hypothetical protein
MIERRTGDGSSADATDAGVTADAAANNGAHDAAPEPPPVVLPPDATTPGGKAVKPPVGARVRKGG